MMKQNFLKGAATKLLGHTIRLLTNRHAGERCTYKEFTLEVTSHKGGPTHVRTFEYGLDGPYPTKKEALAQAREFAEEVIREAQIS